MKRWIAAGIVLLLFPVFIVAGMTMADRSTMTLKVHKVMQDERAEKVTKVLRKTDGVIVAKGMTRDSFERVLKTSKGQVAILMYSDGCPDCKSHVKQIADYSKKLSAKGYTVIAVNDGRSDENLASIRKYFYVPDDFQYPSAFLFNTKNPKAETNQGMRYMYQSIDGRDTIDQ